MKQARRVILHFLAFDQLNGFAESLGPSHIREPAGELMVVDVFPASYSGPKFDRFPAYKQRAIASGEVKQLFQRSWKGDGFRVMYDIY